MKYKRTSITQGKGFGMTKKDEERLREQGIMYVIGYGQWLNWCDLEPDTLTFTQKYWDDANEVFFLLTEGKVIEAVAALRKGPWSAKDIAGLLPELDEWAKNLSPVRHSLGELSANTLLVLSNYGMDTYYNRLMQKHAASVEVTESLQAALEVIGLELLDTGALYSADGEQEGPRDLVMGVTGTDTEYAFRVYHSPRKAETDGVLPDEVKAAVATWEIG